MDPENIDGAIAFYYHLNKCKACGQPLYTTTEMAALMGFSRRTFFRWLAGETNEANNAKAARWLVEHNPLPVRHG